MSSNAEVVHYLVAEMGFVSHIDDVIIEPNKTEQNRTEQN